MPILTDHNRGRFPCELQKSMTQTKTIHIAIGVAKKRTFDHTTGLGIADIRAGKSVIVVDDEDRENEGDIILAAEKVTPEAINFLAKHARGMICVAITSERAQALDLELMVDRNTALHATPFTVTVDAKYRTTTGISAFDRAATIQTIIDPETKPTDLARPGHIFPLVAKNGGVLRRAGHTEAAVDLAKLAGL